MAIFEQKKITAFVSFIIVSVFCLLASSARAESFFYLKNIATPLLQDYYLSSPEGEVGLTVFAGSNNENLTVKMMDLADQGSISAFFTYDSNLSPASDLYFVRFSAQADFSASPRITVKYRPDSYYKEVYYYNWADLQFEKINSERDTWRQTLTFELPDKNSLIFAVFNESEIIGLASWYTHPKYKNELIAASTDLGQDAKIKVINLDNNKEVTVTVKDYGPKKCRDWTEAEIKKMGPCRDRVIDLSKTAFKVLAPTSLGIINVKITPIEN